MQGQEVLGRTPTAISARHDSLHDTQHDEGAGRIQYDLDEAGINKYTNNTNLYSSNPGIRANRAKLNVCQRNTLMKQHDAIEEESDIRPLMSSTILGPPYSKPMPNKRIIFWKTWTDAFSLVWHILRISWYVLLWNF